MKKATRREVLSGIGVVAGAGMFSGFGGEARADAAAKDPANEWKYVRLDSAAVAAEAYRLYPEGGCMYAVFEAVLAAWFKATGRSADSFPFHMMRYGHGGVAGWGSVCGALNGGAALVGLFEQDKKRQEQLIDDLFSWYEATELPGYIAPEADSAKSTKSAAGSILCHVSVARWCKVAGAEPASKERKQRCRSLTAEVAAKAVELLNQHFTSKVVPEPAKLGVKVSSEPPKVVGKMRCAACHEQQ
jgi:hypothetical protein